MYTAICASCPSRSQTTVGESSNSRPRGRVCHVIRGHRGHRERRAEEKKKERQERRKNSEKKEEGREKRKHELYGGEGESEGGSGSGEGYGRRSGACDR